MSTLADVTRDPMEEVVAQLPPILTLADLQEDVETEVEFVLEGLIARGAITLMGSKAKTGKTTWFLHFLRAMYQGQEKFLDLKVRRVPMLLVSEEHRKFRWRRLAGLPAASPMECICKPFLGRPQPHEWTKFCRNLAAYAACKDVRLLAIDPIANLIPGDENSATAMIDFLAPLAAFTQKDIAVFALHHPNKQGGLDIHALRGSGALGGYVDIILMMNRMGGDPETRCREIAGYGREGLEVPGRLYCTLETNGTGYRRLADRTEALNTGLVPTIHALLLQQGEALTCNEVFKNLPVEKAASQTVVYNALTKGVGKFWRRVGEGNRSSPYRYFPLPKPQVPPPSPAENPQAQGGDE